MQNLENKKIAIVCDWIRDWGGAEIVLEQLMELFPQADIFTSVFFQQQNPVFKRKKIITSWLQNIPVLGKSHKITLQLRPQIFESFDLGEYDIVISSTSAESKGVITKPGTLHVCYCHTPTRYFWSHYHEYLDMMEFGFLNIFGKIFAPSIIHRLRKWDFVAAQRPDIFIANSENTRSRITKYYDRESEVIYPCLDTTKIPFSAKKQDYYFYTGRCIPYKKFDLIVDTFNQNGKRIKIATGTDNKLYRKLRKQSKSNIEWIFTDKIDEINTLHSKAKAFIFPPEEDFGLVPIAAQATGTPVIAYKKGGALETVIADETGTFFEEQSIASLNGAIEKFENMSFDSQKIRKHAEQFDKQVFQKNIIGMLQKYLK